MSIAIITGSGGLIGSEACLHFANQGLETIGLDNDMRKIFFGSEASTEWNVNNLKSKLRSNYKHYPLDIRDRYGVIELFKQYGNAIKLIIHTAAQPSHDWAAKEPFTDFDINAVGTLNVLEATRHACPDAVFIFTSTNKVYGDTPNKLPLIELDTRYEIEPSHSYIEGIREDMTIRHLRK